MASNRIPDAQEFRFKDLALHGNLTSITDSGRRRLAVHEYLKRDGGEVEDMGRAPSRYRFGLVFVGLNFRREYKNFLASVDADPRGLLVHPLLGSIQVVYEGADNASIDITRETNSITLAATFVESRVDTNLTAEALLSQGVAGWEQAVTDQIAKMQTAAAPYTGAASQIAALATYGATYASDAADASNDGTPDPSLSTKLADVKTGATDAVAAVRADTTVIGATDATKYEALAAIELVYYACLELDIAAGLKRPPLIEYTIPGQTSIGKLAELLYGRDALRRIDEILLLNRIATPHAIPAGTVIQIYDPS